MKTITILPLDERPCTYNYPSMLASMAKDIKTNIIPKDSLGNKKIPGDFNKIKDFLLTSAINSDYLLIALDTLLYGGIVPSRLHYLDINVLQERLDVLKEIKKINPKIKIFSYHLIMRCPTGSCADEEPDYYGLCGEQIHKLGHYTHLKNVRKLTNEEQKDYQDVLDFIKEHDYQKYVDDYLYRRNINTEMNKRSVDMLHDGIIDFLIIPQDDSAPYGYTAIDQTKVREYIAFYRLEFKALMYPDADAVTNTLLARAINEILGKKPSIYIRYSSPNNGIIIPNYEDRYLSESIKYQIIAAGGVVACDYSCCDIVCMVNVPFDNMQEAVLQQQRFMQYQVNRNLVEYVEYIDYLVSINKPVIVADVAYANGGDLELLKLLRIKDILFKVNSYAGWNTAANTLGTCIPLGMINFIYGKSQNWYDFMALRYVEDGLYMSIVRHKIYNEILKEGYDWFTVDGKKGSISQRITKYLKEYTIKMLDSNDYQIKIVDCYQPWIRLFETGLEVKYITR